MTTSKRNTKLKAEEAVAGDRDLMKALMKKALQKEQERLEKMQKLAEKFNSH